ncbi:MAG: 16S rRNA (cytidine(1402)-2'-O)-methyltransferase [Candidatus Gastranaerophilaceae bacterium]
MGNLYIVALPLGNLNDITLRALEVLKSVDNIACEDTRTTKVVLQKYNISAKLLDCHKFNEQERSKKISELLKNSDVALVSDAGTPCICDPGCVLIKNILQDGHKIIPIPGACAVITFLSALPRNNEFFTFVGFLPKTSQKRIELFNKNQNINCVFYDSPNRLMKTLNDIFKTFEKNKKIAIGRELTKIHEEIKIGTVEEIIEYYNKNTLKGEIVGMLYADEIQESIDTETLTEKIKLLKKQNYSDKDISKILSTLENIPKNTVYELSVKL